MLIKSALQAYAERRIARSRAKHDKNKGKYVGASEIGMCLRRICFSKTSRGAPLEGWGATERGNLFESGYWLPAMRKRYGKKLLYAGTQQKSLHYGHLRATPDGLLVDQPRGVLVRRQRTNIYTVLLIISAAALAIGSVIMLAELLQYGSLLSAPWKVPANMR